MGNNGRNGRGSTGGARHDFPQNPAAFQGNATLPAINPFTNADPEQIAAVLQQLQDAGYSLPFAPPSSMQGVPVPTAYDPTDAMVSEQDDPNIAAREASEEGEVSEGDSMSVYDPEEQNFEAGPAVGASDDYEPEFTEKAPNTYEPTSTRPPNGYGQSSASGSYASVHPQLSQSLNKATPPSVSAMAQPPLQTQNLSGVGPTPGSFQTTNTRGLESPAHPQPQYSFTTRSANIAEPGSSAATNAHTTSPAQQFEDARNFITLLNLHGYTFPDLVRETTYFDQNTNWDILAKIYKDLRLTEPAVSQAHNPQHFMSEVNSSANGTSPAHSMGADQSRVEAASHKPESPYTVATKDSGQQTSTTRPQALADAPKQTSHAEVGSVGRKSSNSASPANALKAPVGAEGRAAYLAKLKAAKLKVGKEPGPKGVGASATPPVQTELRKHVGPETVQSVDLQLPNTSEVVVDNAGEDGTAQAQAQSRAQLEVQEQAQAQAQAQADARKKRKNELLQQRLAALKAKQEILTPPKIDPAPQALQAATLTKPMISSPSQTRSIPNVEPVASPTGGIPGLFMSVVQTDMNGSAPTLPTDSSSANAPIAASANRKRPVAADFEDFTHTSPRPPKQARLFDDDTEEIYEQMVIEVSDEDSDEDSDDEGGVDVEGDVADLINSTADAMSVRQAHNQSSMHHPGPLPAFPIQGLSSGTSSVHGTPGAISTPGQVELSQMELRIAEMKAKIAAQEALKKRKLTESRPATPRKKLTEGDVIVDAAPQSNTFVDSATTLQSQPVAHITSAASATSASPLQAVSRARNMSTPATEGRETPAEHRTRNRADIQSINAHMASNKSRIELLHQEIARLEAENQRDLQEKEALSSQLEALGVDTEGMDKREMEAVRADILQQQKQQDTEVPTASDIMETDMDLDGAPPETEVVSQGTVERPTLQSKTEALPNPASTVPSSRSGPGQDYKENKVGMPSLHDGFGTDSLQGPSPTAFEAAEPNGPSADPTPDIDDEDLYASDPEDQRLAPSANLEDADDYEISEDDELSGSKRAASVSADVATGAHINVPTAGDQGLYNDHQANSATGTSLEPQPANFEQPPVGGLTNAPAHKVMQSVIDEATRPSPSSTENEEGEVDSEGESALYETSKNNSPDLHEEAVERLGQTAPSRSAEILQEFAEEDEDYEPEGFQEADSIHATSSPTSSDATNASSREHDAQSAVETHQPVASSLAGPVTGIAPLIGLFPSEIQSAMPSTMQPVTSSSDAHFQPYQSPLKMFKAYRYHPQYSTDVQGGFRSMTYSHQIDPNRPICPYEADGGTCNDADCQGQHFRGMELTDDMILVQLGTANPGRTEEEKNRWNNGLREVLRQLRTTNTRDPNTVAAAIAKYRSDFLADPTKVLNL